MSVKHKFNVFLKNVWYSYDFCGNFPWFWLIFCYPDPFHESYPVDQNETHPHGSGSATLIYWVNKNINQKIKLKVYQELGQVPRVVYECFQLPASVF